jgi:septal ring factor EnvC (AmiA/AmiB activator)
MSDQIINTAITAFLGMMATVVIFLLRDWRRTRIENKLSEKTIVPKANRVGIEALDAQILAMGKAWDQERVSLNRRIEALEEELNETREERDTAQLELNSAKRELRDKRRELIETKEALDEVRTELRTMRVSWTTRGDGNA